MQEKLSRKFWAQELTASRVRALRDEPHDHKAAERAVGLHSDNGKRTTTTTLMEVDDTAVAE